MSSETTTTKPSRSSRFTSRTSFRPSLNFTSVGKALADVINKEPRDREEKAPKKSKDASRRLSTIALMNNNTAMPHASAIAPKTKPPSPACSREGESTITRTTRSTRRQSSLFKGTSSDEHGAKATDSSASPGLKRSSTLRPRTGVVTAASALPKYRPKSIIGESSKKAPSPTRTSTRRRLSTSEEDDEGPKDSPASKGTLPSPQGKTGRPISPLPHRALSVKVDLPSPVTPSTPQKTKNTTPSKPKYNASPSRTDSARPAKSQKIGSASPTRSALVRPSSPASSCSSTRSQDSPSTSPSLKNAFGFRRPKVASQIPSPLRGTTRRPPESPLANHSRRPSACSLTAKNTPTRLPELVAASSDDSAEAGEVDLLLAPVASLAAPTPAIPRIQYQPSDSPRTPSRPVSLLPTRANLSYLSPVAPTSESSPAMRPRGANYDHHRGSIFSWDQLADNSQMLAYDEVESMLADVTAPFTPGGVSPNVSTIGLEMPDSPSLSALPSPAGYGSISQVLLPDVTPSPAVHHLTRVFETSTELPPLADSGIVALLRLQVAQAEKTARERLTLVHELEEQLHAVRQSRVRETEELAKQVSLLEEQLHASVAARERTNEEQAMLAASLQDELRQAGVRREQAAFVRGQEEARAALDGVLGSLCHGWEVACAVGEAACLWAGVKDQAVDERGNLQANREMLRVVLAVLDRSQEQIQKLLA